MKSLSEKILARTAGAVVVLVGCAMAGIGFTVIAFLAVSVLAAYGLALVASPFVSMVRTDDASVREAEAL